MIFRLAFSLLSSILLVFLFLLSGLTKDSPTPIQQNNFGVHNLNTGKTYSAIKEAIDAPETLDGHEIFVASGIHYEHLTVNKSLSLIGEDRRTTIIDGKGKGKVVYVTANNIVAAFCLLNGTCVSFLGFKEEVPAKTKKTFNEDMSCQNIALKKGPLICARTQS